MHDTGSPRGYRATALILAGVAAALAWWFFHQAPAAGPKDSGELTVAGNVIALSPGAPQWRYVELAVAAEAPPLAPLPAPGRVEFDERRTASVGTPLSGRVEEVRVRVGNRVKAGDRLFSIRSGALADLDRELETARSDVAVKRRLAEHARELVALKALPEKEQLAAEAELRETELALKAALAKRLSLRVDLAGDNLFWVVAPQDGTVVEQDVYASQEVTPDRDKPLLRVADLAEVLVLSNVQEHDAADLHVGGSVTIQSPASDVTRRGTIERVSEIVDPKRRMVEVRVRAKNADGLLRPNAFVEVALDADPARERVRVPAEAVVTDGSESVVFVVRENGRLERVPVNVGRQRDGDLEIREGLQPGDCYVSKGAILLLNEMDLAR